MMNIQKPKVGVVGMAYPGFYLGEEMCLPKTDEMLKSLKMQPLTTCVADEPILDAGSARRVGAKLTAQNVDCILAVITTFVPDYYITALLDACDAPIFLWAVEREINCLSMVCGPLITATLFNLRKHYRLHGADIPSESTLSALTTFARGAMLKQALKTMQVGYLGGHCPIMFSMATDEYALKKQLGTTVINLPAEEFYEMAKGITDAEVRRAWQTITAQVGKISVAEADGLQSAAYYLAAGRLAARHKLDAFSINCFPSLKSKICLAIARLNDDGIAAGCEGDLYSTILMGALSKLTGQAAFNGDLLHLYPADNSILFSHCGGGAFSLAACPGDICLKASIETNAGLAVFYPTRDAGAMTLVNLMSGNGSLRLTTLHGTSQPTDLTYAGTPLRIQFAANVNDIIQRVAQCGAGHHWNGGFGSWTGEFAVLGEFAGIAVNSIS